MAHTVNPAQPADRLSAETTGEPTLGALVASASQDLSALMRSEIELAKTEVRQEVKTGIKGGAFFGVAGFVALLGVILFSVALAYVLVALGLPEWAGFLIIAVLYFIVAAVFALLGRRKMKQVNPPERTIRTSKETAAFLKKPRRENA